MKKDLFTAIWMTLATTILLGLVYPLVVTGAAQILFHEKANGQLLYQDGKLIGSRIIGQPFAGDQYFHSRPSAAGAAGYDAGASSASNLGPTNKVLIDRINAGVEKARQTNSSTGIPVDLVTTSASGLDPHITPAAAEFQVARIARLRGLPEDELRKLVAAHTESRQFGLLGEPRVNVLELNLALDNKSKP